jgi:hypothetical protein
MFLQMQMILQFQWRIQIPSPPLWNSQKRSATLMTLKYQIKFQKVEIILLHIQFVAKNSVFLMQKFDESNALLKSMEVQIGHFIDKF